MRRYVTLAANLLALAAGVAATAHAQQPLQSDSARLGDTTATRSTAVASGLATTIPSKNAPVAVAVVTVSDSTRPPAATLGTLLDGRVPGATIETSASDPPGEGMELRLRGVTSISGNDAPLYVVDGVIVMSQITGVTTSHSAGEGNGINQIVDIDPGDIASIQVLKGPSATAIYGAEGAAGVVIITTKQGTPGTTHWDLSGTVGHASLANEIPLRRFPTLASAQAWYVNDYTHDTTASKIAADDAFIQSIYAGPQDYQAQLFGNSQVSYLTSVSTNGTLAATQYYFSAVSRYDNGVILNTGDDRQSLRGSVTQRVGGVLSLAATVDYIGDVTRQGALTGGVESNPYVAMTYTPAFVDLDRETAGGNWTVNPFGMNPFADEMETSAPALTHRLIAGGRIALVPWHTDHQSLQVQVTGGVDRAGLRDVLLAPADAQSQQTDALPGLDITNTGHLTYTNYSGSFIHHIAGSWLDATTSVGYVSDRQDNTNPVSVGQNLLGGVNTPTPTATVVTDYFYSTTIFQHSYYAQEQVITLASRLALTAGVTAESSTLNSNTGEFFPYPHYAASFRIPRPWSVIDEIKLRVAYGVSGNLQPYGASLVPGTVAQIDGITEGGASVQSQSADIKPEAVRETELGFDMPMFAGRAQLSATVYDKRVSDVLFESFSSAGYGEYLFQNGSFKDQGAELELQATPIQMRSGFEWTTTATFSRSYSAMGAMPVSPFETSLGTYIAPGRSVSEIVNTNFSDGSGLAVQIGDYLPGYEMSFSDVLSFHGFRLLGLADWSRGATATDLLSGYLDFGSLVADSAQAARYVAAYRAGLDAEEESASYFTLRQVVASYSLPVVIVRRIGFGRLASVRLALTGYDLWSTFSFRGPDPQAAEFGIPPAGTNGAAIPYPSARSYYLGLDLGL